MIITLKAKTKKAKERIAQHGDKWMVIRESDRIPARDTHGRFFFIESLKTHSIRWVGEMHDPDFEVEVDQDSQESECQKSECQKLECQKLETEK